MRHESQASRAPTAAYGRDLSAKFGADDAPSAFAKSLRGHEMAVTELYIDCPLGRLNDPLLPVDAYMFCLALNDQPNREYWENGRHVSTRSLHAGDFTLHDQTQDPRGLINMPIHALMIDVPRTAFIELAEQANVPAISGLRFQPAEPVPDDVAKRIGYALLPALQNPERANRLFFDHLMWAFVAHVAQGYGGMQTLARPLKGGLAPWQETRAKELLAANLAGTTSLVEVAGACGLSIKIGRASCRERV